MNGKVIITKYNNKILVARFQNDKMYYLSLFDPDEDILGSIYLCRVTKTLNNINGAFIQYKKGVNGFVKGEGYKQEQILPLQLKKEGSGTKEPLFTDKLSLSSRYAIISSGNAHISVSSKMDDKQKKHYCSLLSEICHNNNINIIVRTNAAYISDECLINDIELLINKLNRIADTQNNRTLYSVLYNPPKSYIKEVLDFNIQTYSEIITDIPEIYDELTELLSDDSITYSSDDIANVKITLYTDKMLSLYHLYKMEHNIKNATDSVIPLKSGAEIVINRTEALTAIDVNTHNSKSKKDKEDTFYETNIEAACEIMRQLQIRNISGMILIDFINMESEKHYKELFDYINQLCLLDSVGTKAVDITGLKLFELVRTKRRKSIYEQMR